MILMKLRIYFLAIIVGIGCNQPQSNNKNTDIINSEKQDSSIGQKNIKTTDEIVEFRKKLLDTNYYYLNHLLEAVLTSVNQKKQTHFIIGKIDSSIFNFKNMYATYEFGNIFSKEKKHLIVKRFINEYADYETSLYSDIYLFENNSFINVASDTADGGYSGGEELKDLNSDGYKDYVVFTYSTAGCCPRSSENGYIYNSQNGHFEFVDFFNRESDYLKKIVYESDYGSPGLILFYKYKWVGLKKILIESIGPTKTSLEMYSFAKPYTYTKILYPREKKKILKEMPSEYKKLEMYDYFISYQD